VASRVLKNVARVRTGAVVALIAGGSALVPATAPLHLASFIPVVYHSGFPVNTDISSARAQDGIIDGTTATTGWFRLSSPTLADLDGDGKKEIVIGSQDGRVYVYNENGTVRWSRYLDSYTTAATPVTGSPAVGDIDGDGSPDVVAGSENGWVFAWNAAGAMKAGWPQFTGWNADYPAHCATNACTGVVASPTLADLDGDGVKEVIVGSYSHKMYVWRGNGSVVAGWPRDVWDGIASGAAVGDINNDGSPEIVVGSDVESDCGNCPPYGAIHKGGLLHAFRTDGSELPGWPLNTDSFMHGTPVLSDLDGDGRLEVISGSGFFPEANSTVRGHKVWAVNYNGSIRWTYTMPGVQLSGPTVADLDGDGHPDIVVADTNCLATACVGGNITRLSQNGSSVSAVWTKTDDVNINGGAFFGQTVVGDVDGDGNPDVIEADANFGVRAYNAAGTQIMNTGTIYSNYGTPAVGDLDGNGTNEVVVGSAAGNGNTGAGQASSGAGRLYVFNTPGHGALLFPQYQTRVVPTTFRPACSAAAAPTTYMPAVRRNGMWYQRVSYTTGMSDGCFAYGDAGDVPVTGDWDGNGSRTVGVFRQSTGVWYLRNGTGGGNSDVTPFALGSPGDIPVVGDWNGSGTQKVGVFRPSTGTWYLAAANVPYTGVTTLRFASPGDVPIVGDWNGSGTGKVGVFRPSNGTWYLAAANVPYTGVTAFSFASPGDIPIAGDWDHNGTVTVGVVRNGTWYLKNSFNSGVADGGFSFGATGDTPLLWG